MGMDLSTYKLLKALSQDDEAVGEGRTRNLYLTAEQVAQLRIQFPDLMSEAEQALDEDKLRALARSQQVPDDYYIADYGQSPEAEDPKGWVSYRHPEEDSSDMLIEVPVFADCLRETGFHLVHMAVQELGYIRKPFRLESTPSRIEGDTLVLSVGNFTGSDTAKLTEIMGQSVMDSSYGAFLFSDIERLKALKPMCFSPQEWQTQVLDVMGPDCVTVIDW